MAIAGYLKTMPVPELFLWIGQCRKTGTLRISLPEGEHTIAFESGRLIFCASTRPDHRLGRLLIHQGRITVEDHEMALKVRDGSAIGIGKILSDLHVLQEDDLRTALAAKAEEQLLELLLADEGVFRFNPEIPELEIVPVEIDLTRALISATHRLDRAAVEQAKSTN